MAAAEDELLLLWSSVEKDKAAVMERRRQLSAAQRSRSLSGVAPHGSHVVEQASQGLGLNGENGIGGLGLDANDAKGCEAVDYDGHPAANASHAVQLQHQHKQQRAIDSSSNGRYQPPGFAEVEVQLRDSNSSQQHLSSKALDHAPSSSNLYHSHGDLQDVGLAVDDVELVGVPVSAHASIPRSPLPGPAVNEEADPSFAPSNRTTASSIPPSQQELDQQLPPAAAVFTITDCDSFDERLLPHYSASSSGRQPAAAGHKGSSWGPPWGKRRVRAPAVPRTRPTSGAGVNQGEPGREPSLFHTLWCMLADVYAVARGSERRAFGIAAALAFFNQATASTAIINYAPELLASRLHVANEGSAILYPVVIALTKCIGVATALMTVDNLGRRPLLILGGVGCGLSLAAAAVAVASGSITAFLGCLCLFILAFSVSWAGLYWVVVSEIFSMTVKSPASSAATALLFLTGALTDFLFLSIVGAMGQWAFILFAAVALAGSYYVYSHLPETKGYTMTDIQALLAHGGTAHSRATQASRTARTLETADEALQGPAMNAVQDAEVAAAPAAGTSALIKHDDWSHEGRKGGWWQRVWPARVDRHQASSSHEDGFGSSHAGQQPAMGLSLPLGLELGVRRGNTWESESSTRLMAQHNSSHEHQTHGR